MRTLVIALLLALPASALADVAPPDDYVETCDVKYYSKPGVVCQSCSAWHGDADACKPLGEQGFAEQCRTWGASTWDEVWCKADPAWTGEPVAIGVDQEQVRRDQKKAKRKALLSCSQAEGGGVGLLALLALALTCRRRRG